MENTECKFCGGVTVENGVCRNCGKSEDTVETVEPEPVPSAEPSEEAVADQIAQPVESEIVE